jgi:methylamine utilization protein MauE
MADALLPLFAMAAGVLLLAGLAKLRSPAAAQAALASFGLPPSAALARAIGAAEAGIGALCLILPGGAGALALAAAYLALTLATGARWSRGEREAPCGCFGDASSSIHLGHVGLNAALALVAAVSVLAPPAGLASALAASPAAGLALVAGVGCSVYLALTLLTLFPDSWRAYGGGDG